MTDTDTKDTRLARPVAVILWTQADDDDDAFNIVDSMIGAPGGPVVINGVRFAATCILGVDADLKPMVVED